MITTTQTDQDAYYAYAVEVNASQAERRDSQTAARTTTGTRLHEEFWAVALLMLTAIINAR